MWLWQHKNIHKRHLLWAKLFGICLFFHLIFLFWIFCVYQDSSYILSIAVNKNLNYSSPIFFVPLGVSTAVQSKQTINPKAAVIKKPTSPKKTAPIPVKKTESSPASQSVKNTATSIVDVKKQTPVASATPHTIMEHKKEEPITTKKPVNQAPDKQQTVVPIIPENAHISHNYREAEALRCSAQLQKELVQKWKPPIGVPPECTCEISFFVTTMGSIENLKMVKGSGVVMYDISARQALFSMKMPQWTHGKSLVINFKQ